MTNTYTISITGAPLGDAKTGVIQQVPWKLTGTDGAHVSVQSGIADLPPIDPGSPEFVPLSDITVPVMLQWAKALLNIPYLKSLIDADISAKQAQAAMAKLQLVPLVAAQAAAGVPV